jgi:hypothetical protein
VIIEGEKKRGIMGNGQEVIIIDLGEGDLGPGGSSNHDKVLIEPAIDKGAGEEAKGQGGG